MISNKFTHNFGHIKIANKSSIKWHATPGEVFSKILNKLSDEENDNIVDIASLAFNDYKNC